jgi:hypothetical protein
MDQRSDPRFAVDRSVTITTLGENQVRQAAQIKNASGSGLGLLVEKAIPPGTALRIEWEDAIVLGEAMYCRPMEKGHFVGVQLEQMLRGLGELRQRFRAFRDENDEHGIHIETG